MLTPSWQASRRLPARSQREFPWFHVKPCRQTGSRVCTVSRETQSAVVVKLDRWPAIPATDRGQQTMILSKRYWYSSREK